MSDEIELLPSNLRAKTTNALQQSVIIQNVSREPLFQGILEVMQSIPQDR